MFIVILTIVVLSLLVLVHEAGHFFVAKFFGMKVEEFGLGFPPRIFAKKIGETEYSMNWILFGGFVRIAGENDGKEEVSKADRPPATEAEAFRAGSRLFFLCPVWQRMLVIFAGVCMNFIVGWALLSLVLITGAPPVLIAGDIEANSPAAAAGFQKMDVIEHYTTAQSFIDFVNAHKGSEISVDVLRNGNTITLHATPRANVAPNKGALGVYLEEGGVPAVGFFTAIKVGFTRSLEIMEAVLAAFYSLVHDLFLHGTLIEGIAGPLGIPKVAQEVAGLGLVNLISFFAVISLNLVVVNLFPFPALDGGQIVVIAIEKLKGSPLPRSWVGLVNRIGLALLLVFIVLISIHDVRTYY